MENKKMSNEAAIEYLLEIKMNHYDTSKDETWLIDQIRKIPFEGTKKKALANLMYLNFVDGLVECISIRLSLLTRTKKQGEHLFQDAVKTLVAINLLKREDANNDKIPEFESNFNQCTEKEELEDLKEQANSVIVELYPQRHVNSIKI